MPADMCMGDPAGPCPDGPPMDELGRIWLEPGQSKLSDAQKRQLYHAGYLVIRGGVGTDLTTAAKAAIKDHASGKKKGYIGEAEAMTNLVNASALRPLLAEAMGEFDPPTTCQFGLTKIAREASPAFTPTGYRACDSPYYGAGPELHLDGSCTIMVPPKKVWHGSPAEIYNEYINSGPSGALGRNPNVIGHNSVPLFEDKEMTLGTGSFSAFVICALNDQSVVGCGQTAILPGAHLVAEKFFRWQRDTGEDGKMGIEGPGWKRLYHNCPNRCGLNYMSDMIRNAFIDETSGTTPDGRQWPQPSPVLMEEGDVCFTVFHIPHSGTRNALGMESRKNIIFRIRAKAHNPDCLQPVNGVSDHPDRGQSGEWLSYPKGVDPFARSKHLLCHPWEVWEGMQRIVMEEQAKGYFGRELGMDEQSFAKEVTMECEKSSPPGIAKL